ncbi:hypothetical protein [Rhodococcoides fascians]|uniref:hypothetical protein n=1 Tax=Rhodococcoides fascians TaxID=1828 RepID=UPI001D3532AC|nr:hypothetical protein [Rhodococcus fascians]CAH0244306.1 Prephenate decarboxylase [Rhodococcus fascians]
MSVHFDQTSSITTELFREDGDGYLSIATLGDEPTGSTCSIDAARKYFGDGVGRLSGFGTFEQCGEAVAQGIADYAVMPAAYPQIHNHFFDARLRASSTFLHQLPDIVAASPHASYPQTVSYVYHHPATTRLVLDLEPKSSRLECTSNTKACADLLASPHDSGTSIAVTNRLAADAFGLTRHRTLAPGENMAFVVFRRAAR